jgi:RNA polymerase sigma-70 factor (ECF subfamily)
MRVPLNESSAFKLLIQGDTLAFDFFYNKYHQAIFANIYRIIQDKTFAQDILHDVFLAFWEKKHTIRTAGSVIGWLYVVSQNKSFTFIKKKLKESTILLENPTVVEQIMESPEINETFYKRQLEILEDAVNHLPRRKKELFSLCRFEGKSVEYAAAALGISEDSAKDYLKQSTRMIKQYIQLNYPTEMSLMGIVIFLALQ